MKYLPVVSLLLMLALSGCDNTPSATDTKVAPLQNQAGSPSQKAGRDEPDLEKLAEQSKGKVLKLQDASELQLDGASALVLTFSIPLKPDQDFSRFVRVVDKDGGKVDGAWELAPGLKELRLRHPEPNRQFIVSVDRNLLALNNSKLGADYQNNITTGNIEPGVGFASRGSLLPGKVAAGLPVIALNVAAIDVNFFRVKPEALVEFIHQWKYRNLLHYWDSTELLKMTDLVYSGRFTLNPAANTREKLLLPLTDIKELQQSGVYLAVMNQPGNYHYRYPATLFTLSDIGLSVHRYANRLDVFSQSLENGAAQTGVEVTLLNGKGQLLKTVTTDSGGYASLDAEEKASLMLARKNGQTTLLDLQLPALDLAEFAIAGQPGYSKQFFMFGPRDLYRGGETVIFNALMRDRDGKPLPAQPVKLEVVKPDGQVVRTVVSQPENGLYQFTYPLAVSAATGMWHIRADTGDNQPRQWDFHVEDFMPERMALTLSTVTTPLAPQDDVTFKVSGRYLYGAPASGNRLQGQLFLRPMRDAVATLPGFQFGDINESNLSRNLDEVQTELDEQGNGQITVQSEWPDARSPLRVILQASLLESGGRPVTRQVQQAVWPAHVMPGIRPQFASKPVYDYNSHASISIPSVDENSNAGFDIVYSNARGERQAVSGLQVRLIRERRDYSWNWSDSDGWRSQYSQRDLPESEQTLDLAAEETGKVSFPVGWGFYRLEVKAPDGALSSVRFQAGYSWQDNSDGAGAIRPDRVTLKIDKPAYQPGDTINLSINAPAAGRGYAMVESSEGVLWWQEIDVPDDGMTLAVPVDKNWKRHDLYLSVLVVRPGDKSRQATPRRAVGLLHLPLGDENRRLNVALNSPVKIRPNQTLTVKIKASTHQGKPVGKVNVLLSAVDSGILNITGYATPDPWQSFLGQKRYGADIYDIYNQVIEGQGRLAALRFGGDGSELNPGGKPPVNHVNIVARQAMPVELDDNGEGVVTLPVGDFNGELRLMAQAWTDDSFGSGESKVIVAAPLTVEMNMPRFLAGGDQSRLALDLTNLTDQTQTLSVEFSASGLVSMGNAAKKKPLTLAAGARTTLFLPVYALSGLGDGEISVNVRGLREPGGMALPLEKHWKIGVRPAYPAQTLNSGVMLDPGQSWSAPQQHWHGISPSGLSGQLVLSGSPPFNIARYIRELKAYPYGCLEQTASGLYPSLYTTAAQLQELGISGDSDDQRRAAIDSGIAHILEMQRENGSFALWNNDGAEEFWLTAYATDFLLRASEQGYSVPAQALKNANNRLLSYLQNPDMISVRYSNDIPASKFAVQAYAGLVLARQQKAPLATLRALLERRNDAASGLPLMQLGIALKLMGDAPRSQRTLELAVNTKRQAENKWQLADYGSELRDNALMLWLLAENQLLPEVQATLVQTLSEQAFAQRWFSTQENNALFLAARGFQNHSASWRAQTTLAQQPLSADKVLSRHISAGQLSQLQISNQGDHPLWVRLDSSGYPVQPSAPSGNVLHISRYMTATDGTGKSPQALKSGELVLVVLNVWADRNVPDALVVDLLPAGLELENQNLFNSSASLEDSAKPVQNLLDKMQQADIRHSEFRDDRFVAAVAINANQPVTLVYLARAVTPGRYRLPPPQVESMYVPQWRATGSTSGMLNVMPVDYSQPSSPLQSAGDMQDATQ